MCAMRFGLAAFDTGFCKLKSKCFLDKSATHLGLHTLQDWACLGYETTAIRLCC